MRYLHTLFSLLAGATLFLTGFSATGQTSGTTTKQITLIWTYSFPPVQKFELYQSPKDLTSPLPWTPILSIPGTYTNTSGSVTNTTSAAIQLAPGTYYFYLTAIDFWGDESNPSNVASTPAPALNSKPNPPTIVEVFIQ